VAFKYRARTEAQWQKQADQKGFESEGYIKEDFLLYKPAKGDNYIRILPPTWEEPEHYGYIVYVHYQVGPNKAAVLCPRKMKNQHCPLCEAQERAAREGDKELADELNAGKRVLCWIIDLKDREKGPQVYPMPWKTDAAFCKLARDPRTGDTYELDNPDNGHNVSFERVGEGISTKYEAHRIESRPSSVSTQFLEFIEEFPLPSTLIWRDYDEIKRLYEGEDATSSDRKEDPRGWRDRSERRDEPPREETRREERREREEPPREERRERDEPPREERRERVRMREEPPPRDDPPPRSERDYGRETSGRDDERRGDTRREETRREPPPRDEPPSGKSRAQELRERFRK